MSDEQKPSSGSFDVEKVRELVRLMKEYELSEILLQDGDKRICLRRGPKSVALPPVAGFVPPPPTAAATVAVPAPQTAAPANKLVEIKCPMVGTFYAKPGPDKDDYVKAGSRVTPETVVCKIEAMKIFNDLTADCAGTIAEVCVQNGQPVEYDQVLFRAEPA